MTTYQTLENKPGFKTKLPVSKDWSAAANLLSIVSLDDAAGVMKKK